MTEMDLTSELISTSDASSDDPRDAPPDDRRQAVLVIHGVGDQRPMDTIRKFVQAVWTHEPDGQPIDDRQAWSKPDTVSSNFDLFQIASYPRQNGVRTDFYELYWADLMTGTRLGAVWGWIIFDLLWPSKRVMPPDIKKAWLIVAPILVALLALTVLSVRQLVKTGFEFSFENLPAAAFLALFGAANWFVKNYAGDAARYLRAKPDNISARQDIRRLGVDVLNRLHEDSRYERIIVVGHSLGTVIGYDILNYSFSSRSPEIFFIGGDKPDEVVALDNLGAKSGIGEWRAAQRTLSRLPEVRRNWNVTDFITLGSPLTYANFLIGFGKSDFESRKKNREAPSCPPQIDAGSSSRVVYKADATKYFDGDTEFKYPARWAVQHSSVFAFTRWTNLFFKTSSCGVKGDIIGGPVGAVFASGGQDASQSQTIAVKDQSLATTHHWGFFTHTCYWTTGGLSGSPNHIQALTDALDLPET